MESEETFREVTVDKLMEDIIEAPSLKEENLTNSNAFMQEFLETLSSVS